MSLTVDVHRGVNWLEYGPLACRIGRIDADGRPMQRPCLVTAAVYSALILSEPLSTMPPDPGCMTRIALDLWHHRQRRMLKQIKTQKATSMRPCLKPTDIIGYDKLRQI